MSLEECLACLWSLAHRNVVPAHHAKGNVSQSANLDNGRNLVLFIFILFVVVLSKQFNSHMRVCL